jgi:hypothetical protein
MATGELSDGSHAFVDSLVMKAVCFGEEQGFELLGVAEGDR